MTARLGIAFADQMHHSSSRRMLKNANFLESSTVSTGKILLFAAVFILGFFGLFLRLFHLQVVEGSYNRELADSNRILKKTISAPRGIIYDRNGQVLAQNNPGFKLGDKFLTRDQAIEMEVEDKKVEIETIRSYPYNEITAHILGFINQSDLIGRAGVEQIYESILKGVDGAEVFEVDAKGEKLRTIRYVEPKPGRNLTLNINLDLQKVAYNALKNTIEKSGVCCGAAIAINPTNGEVLLLVSIPSFNNNAFTDPIQSSELDRYLSSQNSPLLNRVISGTYPPGSTFKITSALAGLNSGKITGDTQIEDTGIINLGPYTYSNWYFNQYGKVEGKLDIVKALSRSNDIFFYQVGYQVGEKVLGETARSLGFGVKTNIDLPAEEAGLVPDNNWKREKIGEVWYPGDSLHLAIGQGFLLATPIQVLMQTSFIAADGVIFKPMLAQKVTQGEVLLQQFNSIQVKSDGFKIEDINLVKKGLEAATQEGGTAWPFFTFEIPTAGKTGTAEFGSIGQTHAWYTSYAPATDPKIALTVLIEAGGEGSNTAASVAKEIYAWYFGR